MPDDVIPIMLRAKTYDVKPELKIVRRFENRGGGSFSIFKKLNDGLLTANEVAGLIWELIRDFPDAPKIDDIEQEMLEDGQVQLRMCLIWWVTRSITGNASMGSGDTGEGEGRATPN